MKFVHIADMHFDKPFTVLESKGLTEQRRLEQRNAFNKMIDYILTNNIDYLFIAGDLYEHEYIRKSTIEYINKCFKKIQNTKIFITPGNHDPYINNSYYNKFNWNTNIKIFKDSEKVELDGINLYGYGFTDFYSKTVNLPQDLNKDKVNILLMHADVNGVTSEVGEYNPILESTLNESNFNYIALGHIHKKTNKNNKIVYPGSMFSGGFDELGEHGMVVGEINLDTKNITTQFIKIDEKEFNKQDVDISNIYSNEELIEKINDLKKEENIYYEYVLIGNKNFDININEVLKQINSNNVIKIKDITAIQLDLNEISKEKTLRGIFVKELLNDIKDDKSNKDEIYKIIEIGLSAMK